MREILFRGKSVVDDKWVEGYYYKAKLYRSDTELCDYITVPYPDVPNKASDHIMVYPETVGQYTGLTDKNGKKIFEGDIFRYNTICKNERIAYGMVEYQNTYEQYRVHNPCGYVIHWGRNNPTASTLREDLPFWCGDFSNGEVIGNIHDNPDLLKGGEDNA